MECDCKTRICVQHYKVVRSAVPFHALFLAVWASVLSPLSLADDETLEDRLKQMEQIILQQQSELEAQQQQLAEQYKLIKQLQSEQSATKPESFSGDTTSGEAPADTYAQQETAKAATASTALAETADQPEIVGLDGQEAAAAELERRQEAGTDEPAIDSMATLYDRSNSIYDPDFPGAWHLPGTTMAMKIGGYANLAVVHNFSPMGSSDSFIVGLIPPKGVDVPEATTGTSVTADQTRINLEVREQTSRGTLRAFTEGDFEGDGSTFRLRHAFGQYRSLLAGKTWSTFANVDALPDEVDFEGMNGVILQRQSQLRFFPKVGKNYNLVFSIEDPDTDIQNGEGTKGRGDLIFSFDRLPLGELGAWNYKVAFLFRDLKGQYYSPGTVNSDNPINSGSTTGWGITTSGRKSVARWGTDDFVQWQFTYGKGIGHYINDLATIGRGDAVFSPDNELHALPVFAGFVSYSHTWGSKPRVLKGWPGLFRSNIMLSWVDVNNYEFQADDSYNRTWRASTNLFYFPTQNVRFGAEFLWGQRVNKDNSKGSATQLQVSARYSY